MTTQHTITVRISQSAQQQAVRSGLPAAAIQTYEMPADLAGQLLALGAEVTWDGEVRAVAMNLVNLAYHGFPGISGGGSGQYLDLPVRPADGVAAVAAVAELVEAARAARQVTLEQEARVEARVKAEQEAKTARIKAEAEEWARLPLAWRATADGVATCSERETYACGADRLAHFGFTQYRSDDLRTHVPAAFAEAEAEVKRLQNEAAAKLRAAEAQRRADQEAWIRQHGSSRLQRCLQEGIEVEAAYRDERLALERPGWRWEEKVNGSKSEPRNPPGSTFLTLDAARKIDPEAKLHRWTVEHDRVACEEENGDGCECEKYEWVGYVALGDFLGKLVLFGGPEE